MDAGAVNTWKAVLGDLQLQVSRPIYDTWLRNTLGVSMDGDVLTVEVPTSFSKEWLEQRMYHLIQKTATKVAEAPIEVRFRVAGGGTTAEAHDETPVHELEERKPVLQQPATTLNRKYTFQRFVVGPSNQLPYNAAMAAAESPGGGSNPLFIYSGVGLGKTHLLQAIGQHCIAKGHRTLYVTSERFTNEFIAAIRSKTTDDFRARYRNLDVLLIDDVQFISGKEQTQEGFFHTFNDLHYADHQVVLTADRPPKAMHLLEDRLVSRFEGGLVADIQQPDLETRLLILRSKADQMSVKLDDPIIEYLAQVAQTSVRQLEGSLNRVVAYAQMTQQPISLELVSQLVADLVHTPNRRALDADTVVDETAGYYHMTAEDLRGPSRKKDVVRARHVAMYLLHEEKGMRDTDIQLSAAPCGRSGLRSTLMYSLGATFWQSRKPCTASRQELFLLELLRIMLLGVCTPRRGWVVW